MRAGMSEFRDEQKKALAELIENFRKARVAAARKAAIESATRIKALNARVRDLARSGVKLTGISQGAAQSLIELQSDSHGSADRRRSAQLQRIADTASVRDLARDQAEVLQAARQRIVDDIARAMKILKGAAREARGVVERPPARPAAPKKVVRRSAKPTARRKVRKTARRGRRGGA